MMHQPTRLDKNKVPKYFSKEALLPSKRCKKNITIFSSTFHVSRNSLSPKASCGNMSVQVLSSKLNGNFFDILPITIHPIQVA
jgi:hypothetical protein